MSVEKHSQEALARKCSQLLHRRNVGERENRMDLRAIWHVWSRGVSGSVARGERRGAAGTLGFLAHVAGWLGSLGLPVLGDILGCVGKGQRGGWGKNCGDRYDLRCAVDTVKRCQVGS